MSSSYRVHYKKGDVEVEVESSDKDYVDQMLQKLLSSQASQSSLGELAKKNRRVPKPAVGRGRVRKPQQMNKKFPSTSR